MLNYHKKPSKIGLEQIAHAEAVLKQAEADGLLLKPEVQADKKEAGSVDELKYWGRLLERLGKEGSEDARKLMSDVEAMMENEEDIEVVAKRFVGGLMRFAVVTAYEKPVPPGNVENFSMRMPSVLLEKMDSAIAEGAAKNRSEFVRSMLGIAFAAGDLPQIKYTAAITKILALLMENPEEALLFYLIRSFFNRPDVGSVAKMLALVAGPLTEIIAAVGGEGIERVKETVGELFETLNTPDSESEESEDAANHVE